MNSINAKYIPSQLIRRRQQFYKDKKYKILDKNKIKKYILFIDGYIGGGTSFFSDCIINYYKKFTNFVIVKKMDEKLIVTYNFEFRLVFNNYDEIINFLDDRTLKIFINHLANHSMDFINNLFNTLKEVSIITHDHYFIYKTGCSIFDINKVKNNELLDIKKYNKLFTQNINNIKYLDQIIPNEIKQKFIINELPDFKNRLKKLEFTNSKIKIGIIGVISPQKGEQILNKLFLKFKNNYDFFVFGIMNHNKNISQSKYNNIYEFNNLLEQEKPNLFISLSTCPETYSYTTTLMNITSLPVLFYTANNPVVKDRLINYKEFNLKDLDLFERNINKLKQNYLYTIEPNIYFNNIWDTYFKNS